MSEVISSFPQGFGNRPVSMLKHAGPASYARLVVGTPPTGGDVIAAPAFGLKFINGCFCDGISDDGQYGVAVSNNPNLLQVELRWFVLSTGTEVANAVNLSARTVRLFAIGH